MGLDDSKTLSKSTLDLNLKGIIFHASDPRSGEYPLTTETYNNNLVLIHAREPTDRTHHMKSHRSK
jgi:hypothetical protein